MNIANKNYLHAAVLLETLGLLGVRQVVISPGSRSTPLARTAYLSDRFQCEVILDERSAGYFAMGCAKASQLPTILICTSGTAGANYYPAVIEAAQSGVPLVVLTADRPASVRHRGALQTIDQSELFGKFVKLFVDLPEAEPSLEYASELRRIALNAWQQAVSEPRGPVHLNVPFDEPLAPTNEQSDECTDIYESVFAEALPSEDKPLPVKAELDSLFSKIDNSLCGLIVAGPHAARNNHEAEAIHGFARQLGWPVLTDAVSGLRFYSDPVFPYFDLFIRSELLQSLSPDLVIEFGMCPTSKALNEYLNRHRDVYTVRIQPNARIHDPFERANETIIGDVLSICNKLSSKVQVARDSLLYDPFQRASRTLHSRIHEWLKASEWNEVLAVKAAIDSLPDDANLVLASSLSLRYAEMIAANEGKRVNVFAQRGTNGIEGMIAQAAGVASASNKHTLLLIGDLAFCHDIGSLAAARKHAENLTIVLFNNNGGGIFHLLPIVKYQDTFEALHGTPHDITLNELSQVFDLDWRTTESLTDVQQSMRIDNREKLRVIEAVAKRSDITARLQSFIEEMVSVVS